MFGSNAILVPAARNLSTNSKVSLRLESLSAGVIPVTKRYLACRDSKGSIRMVEAADWRL